MTTSAMARMERRRRAELERRRERAQMIVAAILACVLFAAMALAGEMDYQDRTQGLGASMLPSEGWTPPLGWGE